MNPAYKTAGRATTYNGVRFRSRLEARWAHFFSLLGVEWRYEPETFLLPSGQYTPDFRLSWRTGHALWAEVKPADFKLRPYDTARYADFAGSGRVLLLLDGQPTAQAYARADVRRAGGDGIVLTPGGPFYSLDRAGKGYDMSATETAAKVACRMRFA